MRLLASCAILCVACVGGCVDRAAVVTRDSAGVRITESAMPAWSADGRLIRTEPLGDRIPNLRLSGGGFAYLGFASLEDGTALGQSRPLMALVRIAPDGSRDTLASMPGHDIFRIMRNRGVSSWEPPFGLHRYLVAHDGSFYTGDGSAFEVTVLDTAGRVVRIMRRPDLDVAVTGERVDRWRASQLALSPTEARETALNTIMREATIPDRQPDWNALALDALGDVWVRHYALDRQQPSTWTVFDPDGRWLGEVGMPASFDVREIGADYLLGVHVDSLGGEYVEPYAIRKD